MNIGDVAKLYKISYDTIRYYEKLGILGPIKKDTSGNRDYSEVDIDRLYFILCMKKAGLTLNEIKDYVALYQQGNETVLERLNMLESQQTKLTKQINDLNKTSVYLQQKIERYQQLIKTEKQ